MAVVNSVLNSAGVVQAGVIAAPTPVQPSDNSMPGMGAFIVFAFLAVALYFILKNMNALMRRMSYREREREAAEAAAHETDAASHDDLSDVDLRDPHAEPVVADEPETAPEVDEGESGEPHTDSR